MSIEPIVSYEQVSGPGDSGSLWIDTATNLAVGLHFAGSDVPGIVGLGKLRKGGPVVGQADHCVGAGSADWRTSAQEKAQVLGGFRLTMNCIGCAQKGVEANQGREFPACGGEKRAVGIKPET